MAIRLIRIFTGDDDQSHFSVGEVEWNETEALNAISKDELAQGKSSNPAISYWQRTLRAADIAGAWSTINRGVASTSPCRKRDAASNAKGDQSMSEYDDKPPAEVLRGERFAML